MQAKQHQVGVVARAGRDRGLDAPFDPGRRIGTVGGRERLWPERAVGHQRGRRRIGVRGRFVGVEMVF